MGIRETQELGHASRRFLVTMSPAMAPCWEDSGSYNDEEMEPMHGMYCTLGRVLHREADGRKIEVDKGGHKERVQEIQGTIRRRMASRDCA